MANYYTDHPEIEFHLSHPLMKRIVDLKERNYEDKDNFADAPVCYEDAIENYKRILDITGDVAANIIEPNSEDVVKTAFAAMTYAQYFPNNKPARSCVQAVLPKGALCEVEVIAEL